MNCSAAITQFPTSRDRVHVAESARFLVIKLAASEAPPRADVAGEEDFV
jgi:hypothetical protein